MRYLTYCIGCLITALALTIAYAKRLEKRYHRKLGH